MSVALLRGRDHDVVGRVVTLAEDRCALALSRGGAPKRYAHKDPNEDAVAFARGAGGTLLAAADGHGGSEAAEQALDDLLTSCAPVWTAADMSGLAWEQLASDAVRRIHRLIVAAATAASGNPDARTTLSFALVRPGEDLLAWASAGDSHVFRIGDDGVRELGPPGTAHSHYLGSPSLSGGTPRLRCGWESLARTGSRVVVLATDGLSERGIGVSSPVAAVSDAHDAVAAVARELRPLELARGITARAMSAHEANQAGDNVGVACWLET